MGTIGSIDEEDRGGSGRPLPPKRDDYIASLRSELAAERDARGKAEKFLRALTPGGSEFQTPEECAGYARRVRDEQFAAVKRFKSERDEARAEREHLRELAYTYDDATGTFSGKTWKAEAEAWQDGFDRMMTERDEARARAEQSLSRSLAAQRILLHASSVVGAIVRADDDEERDYFLPKLVPLHADIAAYLAPSEAKKDA